MQQRLRVSRSIKVPALAPKVEIGNGEDSRDQASSVLCQMIRRQEQYRGKRGSQESKQESRKEPSHSAQIEVRERKIVRNYCIVDETSNEESTDHEKDIDADKTTRESTGRIVVQDDAHHCDSA